LLVAVDPSKTIGIALWAGQARGGVNYATCYGQSQPRIVQHRSMRELFIGAYARFADLCREVDEPGLAMLAVDETTGAPAGLVRLRARPGRHVAAIVGRHDACDLFLSRHASLALRHLAVVLEPPTSYRRGDATVRYRILDLRTESGFLDEHGKAMRGLRAEGPAMMRVASHAIFVLPLGDPSDWPMNPQDAWDMLPERVYFDEMQYVPDGSVAQVPIQGATRRSTIYRTQGPRDTGVGLVERGDVAGVLEIIGETRMGVLSIGDRALQDGILLGRYARCDGAALLEDPSLSRVHALMMAVDDRVLVIDTASRNGTWETGKPAARVTSFEGNTEVHLGKHTRIRWRWAA
jgi:hypothetical protein